MDRDACERRVFRLALLLTGDPVAAVRVIRAVVGGRLDVMAMDSAHLDRLTILRAREAAGQVLADPALDARVANALAGLEPQQREAWVLRRVYATPPRETARAMDCSVTASERHLALADQVMGQSDGGGSEGAALTLRRYSMSQDVPAFHRRRQRRVRIFRRVLVGAALLVAVAGIVGLIAWRYR